ncbi:hypothetical protein JCM11491_003837 [Sporobolomyces phaffii]
MPLSTLRLFSFSRSPTTRQTKTDSGPPRPTLLGLALAAPDRLGVTREKDGAEAGHPRLEMGHSATPARARSRSPNPNPTTRSRDRPIQPRSRSRRRYGSPPATADACPYCPERDSKRFDNLDRTARSLAAEGRTRVGDPTDPPRGSDDGTTDLDLLQGTRSSGRYTASRPPLFDDVDDLEVDHLSLSSTSTSDEDDDYDLDGENESLFSVNSPPTSAYSLGRSPSTRKSSLSTTATSDPLISPSSVPSVPVLSFGSLAHQRGHWLPATPDKVPAPSAESQFAPHLPDAPPPPTPGPLLSSSPEKHQNSSLRRASSLTSFSPSRPSLLSKSLRSLASLPNLTLPNLLPQLHRPDIYLSNSDSQSPALTSGWGAKERRRVLDSEPSWDADEARGLLSRRAKRSLSIGGSTSMEGESEAAASSYASMNGSTTDADLALSDFSTPAPVSPPPSPILSDHDSSPCDVAPPSLESSTPPAPPSPPPPSQRFISNTRHLLMLSIEFSMMRADKISSPLRPRAVIVRNGSPTRGGGQGLGPSRLRNEVVV